MPLLFEYGDWIRVSHPADLKGLLRQIWDARMFVDTSQDLTESEQDTKFQPFLSFDGELARANNFIGFIQYGDEVIEIYPKVFKQHAESHANRDLMLRHIFFWFDYCRKWRFPFTQSSLDTRDIESFPELIINLIARQFYETVSNQPLSLYQSIEESLQTPKGAINFKRYINNGFASGNLHVLDCDHEPFLFDNRVNRAIKYCCRLLMGQTKLSDNLRILQETVFVMDEVQDTPFTLHDLETMSVNSFFSEYSLNLDACRMILGNQLYSNTMSDLSQWCMLFPMEYIFEDFIAGFVEEHFGSAWKVEYQKSDMFLVDEPYGAFMMQHDIFLTSKASSRRKLIIDTKYKIRPRDFKADAKRGVLQSDLYQMASYAFRRGCDDILLLYPNISENLNEPDQFLIRSGHDPHHRFRVTVAEVPFWTTSGPEYITPLLRDTLEKILSNLDS